MGVVFVIYAYILLAVSVLRLFGKYAFVFDSACFCVFLGLFIQGQFLSNNLPSLNGEAVDWSLYSSGRMPSVILWACMLVLAIVLIVVQAKSDKFALVAKVINVVTVCIIVFLVLTLVFSCFGKDVFRDKTDVQVMDTSSFIRKQLHFAGVKYLPYDLKQYCVFIP